MDHATRRAAIVAMAGLPVMILPAPAQPADQHLLALGRQWDAAQAAQDEFIDTYERVAEEADTMASKAPAALLTRVATAYDRIKQNGWVSDELNRAIFMTPATTIAGLAIKAKVATRFGAGIEHDADLDLGEMAVRSILRDLCGEAV